MTESLRLPERRYTLIDSVRICFRCAPTAAFFYGFFDLASAAVTPLKTLVVAAFIDEAIASFGRGAPTQGLYGALGLVAFITAFQWVKTALHNFADLRLVLALRERYRTALTEKRSRLAYRHVEDPQTYDLLRRIAEKPESGRLKASYFHLVDMASFLIKIGGLLVILTTAVWWGGPAVLAVSALSLVTGVRGGAAQYRAEQEVARSERRSAYLAGLLVGREPAAERALFGFTGMVNRMWRRAFESALAVRLRTRLRWYVSAYSGSLVSILSWTFIMVILLSPLRAGSISVGLFIALTQAFTGLNIVWGFMDTVHGLAADAAFFGDLTAFVSLDEEPSLDGANGGEPATAAERRAPSSASADPTGPHAPPTLAMGHTRPFEAVTLELRDVWFRYPGTERWILRGVSCLFEPGRHYAVVGPNGAGKTTLTRLITGLYAPEAGSILANGREIRTFNHDERVALFAVVYQDFARYSVSFQDNISLGADTAAITESEEWYRLLRETGLSDTIDRLPQGAATRLGKLTEDGVDLSGGEWQRVAMARALFRPTPIRILDEPTAALDPKAESAMYELFHRVSAGATTLLVSHRLGATKIADSVVVLADGSITEQGTHGQLMQRDGLYAHMYRSQRSWYET